MRRSLTLSLPVLSLVLASAPLWSETIAFDPARSYAMGDVPESLAFGDLNGDGKLDVVAGNTFSDTSTDGSISILLGNGDGTFNSLSDLPVGGRRPEGVAITNVNTDAFPDVVTANFSGNSVSVLLGKGNGSFEDPIVIPVPGGPRFIVAADFNGDGFTDLATSNYNGNSVSILKGDGTGSFTITATITVGRGPEMLALAQLTPDHNIDLVTCNAIDNTVTPLQGDGAGGFSASLSYTVGTQPRFLLAHDLDGDGLDDLVVANYQSHTVTLERNSGFPTFTNAGSLSYSTPTLVLEKPVYLALADINNDGGEDLLVTWAESGVFTVFPRGLDSFDFGAPAVIQTGRSPVGIGAADFDGDGDTDVIVTNAEDDTAFVYLSYLTDPGVIVDDRAPGTTPIGPWPPSDAAFPFGEGSLFSKDGTSYIWTATLPAPGEYEVLLWWTVTPSRSRSVPVEVTHSEGKSGLLVNQAKDRGVWHSLGAYTFGATGTVTLTAPQDNLSASVDAVRFRKVTGAPAGPPRGKVPVTVKQRPDNFQINGNTSLAFQATLTADNPNESEDFTSAVFLPIGDAEESQLIAECRLYIDSNGNGVYDSGDRQLGVGRKFGSDIRAIVFDGFRETLTNGTPVEIFAVADLVPPAVAARTTATMPISPVLACGAALGLSLLFRKSRKALSCGSLATALLLSLVLLPANGCGSGGGGHHKPAGNPQPQTHDLKIELSSLVIEGSASGTPSTNQGLPADGWTF